jgi:hypothetical protein
VTPPAIPSFDALVARFFDRIDAIRDLIRGPAGIAEMKAKIAEVHAMRCEDRHLRRQAEALAARLLVQAARRDVHDLGAFSCDRREDVAPGLGEVVSWYAKLSPRYRERLGAETHAGFAEARRIVERARKSAR